MGTRSEEVLNGPITDEPMRYESQRLATFSAWPKGAKVGAEKIAKAGFYYTGSYLEVDNDSIFQNLYALV